ncbi:MAG: pyruvate kinase alpha/beta domain-containing protein [Brevinematia bacterium]
MVCFEKAGKTNTQKTIEIALKVSEERKIKNIVFPSASGWTATFFENVKNKNLVCVTHAYGFAEKGKNEMDKATRLKLENNGIKILTTTHVLSGAERGLSKKFGGIYPVEIVANTLRMFGQGLKVATEIAIMALDAGIIPYGEKIISLGGTEEGVDTAIIIVPSHASMMLETKIIEILCKPVDF